MDIEFIEHGKECFKKIFYGINFENVVFVLVFNTGVMPALVGFQWVGLI